MSSLDKKINDPHAVITALDVVNMRDFPVACDENGKPIKESLEKAEKERERMMQWALEYDLRMANRRFL